MKSEGHRHKFAIGVPQFLLSEILEISAVFIVTMAWIVVGNFASN